jgi:hypothetical protein
VVVVPKSVVSRAVGIARDPLSEQRIFHCAPDAVSTDNQQLASTALSHCAPDAVSTDN